MIDGKLVKSRHIQYIEGSPDIPQGLQKCLKGLQAGDRKRVSLSSRESYGAIDPALVVEKSKSTIPPKDHFIGRELRTGKSGKFMATVKEIRQHTLLLDYNHPYAGKKLCYDVRIVGVKTPDPSAQSKKRRTTRGS